ncbi:hypothetical protein B0H10DRAFT_2185722 [Mycena sp. CBHHK59/15]|nr:hypothetical protein B0H10DRAFT_2185722 [Mycena sp. CBHHK59/15]
MAYNETAVLQLIDNQHFYNVNLGPFCIGITAQVYMMGILTLQTWQYFEEYATKDNRRIKALVAILFLASAFQCATDFYMMYDAFVTGYGRIGYWNKYGWTLIFELPWTLNDLAQAFIAALAQSFFLHRCWTVTRRPSVVVAGIFGIMVNIRLLMRLDPLPDLPTLSYGSFDIYYFGAPGSLGSTTVVEGLILSQIMHLLKFKTGFKNTSSRTTLSRIVRLTFETAALTSVLALINFIVFVTSGKKTAAHLIFQFMMGKMYNHSVMVTLLARKKFRDEYDSNSAGHQGNADSSFPKFNTAVGITVTQTQIRTTDHVEYPMRVLTPTEGNEGENLEFHIKPDKKVQIV